MGRGPMAKRASRARAHQDRSSGGPSSPPTYWGDDDRTGGFTMTVSSASPALKEKDPGNRLFGPLPDVQQVDGYEPGHPPRVGFFTDTSVCIGCKACEVACKEWNTLPMDDSH